MYVCHCNRIPKRDILSAIDRLRLNAPSLPPAPGDVLVELSVRGKCMGCFPAIADMLDGTNHSRSHSSSGDNSGCCAVSVCNGVVGAQKPGRRGGAFARRSKA